MNENEQSLRDIIKLISILILGIPKRKRDRKEQKKYMKK